MKKLGYILITIGFILASLTTVTDHLQVNWTFFTLTLAISVLGIFLVRSSDKAENLQKDTLATDMKNMERTYHPFVMIVNIFFDCDLYKRLVS